jgi:3'(2'), 5'-bisphosphate nucleotidase
LSTLNYTELAKLLFITVEKAGKTIMEYYDRSVMNVQLKRDDSPITNADLASNEAITKALSKTGIPLLSEETKIQDFHIRKNWKRYWLIDPLDGTKEFINKNGEFTINIALIEDNIPTLGAVSIPEKNKIYIGGKSLGYSKLFTGDQVKVLKMSQKGSFDDVMKAEPLRVVASRSHQNSKMGLFLEKFSSVDLLRMGSSLKFMSIVDQKADIYPRFSPCMEWDTAASDAILRCLGYQIRSISDSFEVGNQLIYNKENLYNSAFVAY